MLQDFLGLSCHFGTLYIKDKANGKISKTFLWITSLFWEEILEDNPIMHKVRKWWDTLECFTANVSSLTVLKTYALKGKQISKFFWKFKKVILVISAANLFLILDV